MDQKARSGDKAGAAKDAAQLASELSRLATPQATDDPRLSSGVNDFVVNVYDHIGPIRAHLRDYVDWPDAALVEEDGIVVGAGWIDAYTFGTDGRAPLCPAMPAESPYPLFSPGVTPFPGFQLPQ